MLDPLGFFAEGKLKRIELSGGPPQTLCNASPGVGASWSPEGVIVFGMGTAGPLYKVSTSGGVETLVTSLSTEVYSHRWPQFLPDGRTFSVSG